MRNTRMDFEQKIGLLLQDTGEERRDIDGEPKKSIVF